MSEVFEPDNTIEGADWTKNRWDLPPYKSVEFLIVIGGESHLAAFRELPVYKAACANGLINDDEWVADYASPINGSKE